MINTRNKYREQLSILEKAQSEAMLSGNYQMVKELSELIYHYCNIINDGLCHGAVDSNWTPSNASGEIINSIRTSGNHNIKAY